VRLLNNEEKILALLEGMNGRLDSLEQGQSEIREDMKIFKSEIKEDISIFKSEISEELDIIKEDVAITRNAANTLLDWATVVDGATLAEIQHNQAILASLD
jgi:hypothetical protein